MISNDSKKLIHDQITILQSQKQNYQKQIEELKTNKDNLSQRVQDIILSINRLQDDLNL